MSSSFFLNKTFCDGVYCRKQNNYPKKGIPGDGFDAIGFKFKTYVTHENGRNHIQYHTVERVLLSPFKYDVFHDEVFDFLHFTVLNYACIEQGFCLLF